MLDLPVDGEWFLMADRFFAVERFTLMPSGGHFAALDVPTELAADLTAFLAGRS